MEDSRSCDVAEKVRFLSLRPRCKAGEAILVSMETATSRFLRPTDRVRGPRKDAREWVSWQPTDRLMSFPMRGGMGVTLQHGDLIPSRASFSVCFRLRASWFIGILGGEAPAAQIHRLILNKQ